MICEVTDFCNLNCSFCYEKTRRKKKHISPEVFENILKRYRPLYLQITGGEATTHPEFEKIVNIGVNNSIKTQISTNGVLLKKIIPVLLKIPFRKRPIIGISLDASNEDHDIIRGHKGLFKSIMKSIVEYKKKRIPFGFATTVFDKNYLEELPEGNIKHVPNLIKLANELHVPINIQPCAPTEPSLRKKLGKILIENKSRFLVNTQPYLKILINGHKNKCRYTWTNISIGTSGNILPTRPDNCYFCNDCSKCYYSCVWEPSLITSRYFFQSLLSFINQATIIY
ncbi:MAG: radical SAM protein [Candidatus Helarchaeota archaeon]